MKIIKYVDEYLEEFIMGFMMLIILIIMMIQVTSRYIFNYSLSWSEEIVRYLYIWMGFISIGYCIKKSASIRVEEFIKLFSGKARVAFNIINIFIQLIFFMYLIPFSYKYLMACIESNQVSPAMGMPMYFVQAAPLVGFILAEFRLVQSLYNECKKTKGEIENV